jgi:hypothetical protein
MIRESRVSVDVEPGIPMPGSTDVLSTDNTTTFFDFTAEEKGKFIDKHVYNGLIVPYNIFEL